MCVSVCVASLPVSTMLLLQCLASGLTLWWSGLVRQGMSGEVDKERAAHAMADPEIQV